MLVDTDEFTLSCRPLSHTVDAIGYRLVEPDGRRMLPEKLMALGIEGPAIGRLRDEGQLEHDGGVVTIDDVSVRRRGQVFALVSE